MVNKPKAQKSHLEPSITKAKAKSLIQMQLERAEEIRKLKFNDPKIPAWSSATENFIAAAYGKPNGEEHENFVKFKYASGGPLKVNMSEPEKQKSHEFKTDLRIEFLKSFIEQLDLLDEIVHEEKSDVTEISFIKLNNILSKFHKISRQLRSRHDSRQTLEVNDEYDVQDLVHALLKIDFEDIRAEEYTPSYAGKSTRMDFLLKDHDIVLEIKKTRPTLKSKEIGDELIADIARYQSHPACSTLICFIYDPDGFIVNPQGLIRDLKNLSNDKVRIEVIISPE